MAILVLPLKEQLLKAMKVAENSMEAADYLVQQYKKIVAKSKEKVYVTDIIQRLEKYAEFVKMKLSNTAQPWSGEQAWLSDFQNMQKKLALAAVEMLIAQEVPEDIHLDIAINESAQILRAYTKDKNALDPKQIDQLDTLFNSWLAEHNIVSLDGILYEADIHGNIRQDKENKVKITPEKIRNLIDDKVQGFAVFLKKSGMPSINIRQHILPPGSKVQAFAKNSGKPKSAEISTSQASKEPTPSAKGSSL